MFSGNRYALYAFTALPDFFARSFAITFLPPHPPVQVTRQPRAIGSARVSSKLYGQASVLDGLHQAGALKLAFPRGRDGVEAIAINTAGGITGGDRFNLQARAGAGTKLCITTQAAERAYRAQSGEVAQVETRLIADAASLLHWLPQEMILFDGCALNRSLHIDLARDARLLMVEPVVFGRTAMGESLNAIRFVDRIEVTRAGLPLYLDATRLLGNATAHLARPAIANGARAMASLLYVAPDAAARLAQIRQNLPATAGASLLAPGVLVARLLGKDSFTLRKYLVPILDCLSNQTLPASWRL